MKRMTRRFFTYHHIVPFILWLIATSQLVAAFAWGKDDPEGRVKNAKVS